MREITRIHTFTLIYSSPLSTSHDLQCHVEELIFLQASNITLNMVFNVALNNKSSANFQYHIEYGLQCCVEELTHLHNFQYHIEYIFQCRIDELIFSASY